MTSSRIKISPITNLSGGYKTPSSLPTSLLRYKSLAIKYESSSPFTCRRYSRLQAIANNHPLLVFRGTFQHHLFLEYPKKSPQSMQQCSNWGFRAMSSGRSRTRASLKRSADIRAMSGQLPSRRMDLKQFLPRPTKH